MSVTRRALWTCLLSLAMWLLASAFIAVPESQAVVCWIEGEATLEGTATEQPRPLRLWDLLAANAELHTGDGSSVTIGLLDGRRYRVEASSRAVLKERDLEVKEGRVTPLEPVPAAVELAPLVHLDKAGTRPGGSRIRQPRAQPGGPTQLYPSHEAAVLPSQAVLTFSPLPNAERYRVEIGDEAGNPVLSVETDTPRVEVPGDLLGTDAFYSWRVEALDAGEPRRASYAVFVTPPFESLVSRRALAEHAAQSSDASLKLLLAAMDHSLGLQREACQRLHDITAELSDAKALQGLLSELACEP